jgi:4-hydroxy-tetrahydrodipicolinate synthase
MNGQRHRHRLKGVIAAVVTPLDRSLEPDAGALGALGQWLLGNGCDGLNIMGTTGEATSLSLRQRMRLMSEVAKSGLPLDRMMVGTGAAAMRDAVELTRAAAECGFAGALVLPPFYYKNVPEDGVLRYIEAIVMATARTPIPLYLYHFPAMSGVPYGVALVRRLLDGFGERIAGLKDSSGDLAHSRAIAALSDRLAVFPGSEIHLAEARDGALAGCISATANLTGAFCAKALHGRDDAALAAAIRIRKLFEGGPMVPRIKAVLARLRGEPPLAEVLPPFARLPDANATALFEAYLAAQTSVD